MGLDVTTSPFSSSHNNINIGNLFFNGRSRLNIYQIGTSLPCVIFPLRNQIKEILGGMGVISTMGTPMTSQKRKISSEMSLIIIIITPSWSLPIIFPKYETYATLKSSSKALRSFVDPECRPIKSICKST
jgi:hypothetical protein